MSERAAVAAIPRTLSALLYCVFCYLRVDRGTVLCAGASGQHEHSGRTVRGGWRLPCLGGAWGVEESNIRLPPLRPGQRFGDHYRVRHFCLRQSNHLWWVRHACWCRPTSPPPPLSPLSGSLPCFLSQHHTCPPSAKFLCIPPGWLFMPASAIGGAKHPCACKCARVHRWCWQWTRESSMGGKSAREGSVHAMMASQP